MEVVIVADARAVGEHAAEVIARILARRERPTFGLATGSSPLPVYDALVERHRHGAMSFASTSMFLLDEYVGLPVGHQQSYRRVVLDAFCSRVDVPPVNVHGPDVQRADLEAACADYEASIASAGGIDVQLLGIGTDGHIGFNEPVSSLRSRTRIKTLTSRTRRDNARFFASPDDVPVHVVTQGIGTILDAGHLVLVAFGASKADPVARAVEGPLAAMFPASALQLHPHATVIVDEPASASLQLAGYYRDVYAQKPAWQR